MPPNDMMMQAWPASHGVNNSFYPLNSHRATPPYNIPYDPNQHVHAPVSNTISNHSPVITREERLPKKVQFLTPLIQQQTPPSKPLSSTQSLHELNVTNSKMPLPIATQPVRLSKRASAPRPSTVMRNPSPAPASLPKPIYIGIDHQATLAERGETIANKRHRKNTEKNHSDGLNSTTNTQQSRSQHKQATDSPRSDNGIMPSKSFDSLQPKVSGLQHTKIKSMSTNKINQNIDQMPSTNNEMKSSKSASTRRQQSSINNEIKPMKSREIHRPNSRQRQQRRPNESNLLLPIESSKRRIEHIHSNSPVMRIPLSTNNRKQPIILSGVASKASVSRTRI
jgi:hypothetical protein